MAITDAAVLHYIYDPLCGWCYGAAPLARAAHAILPVILHGGGMMAGNYRQLVSPQLRDYILPHDRRIAALTGQVFGQGYVQGLLQDTTALLDSEPSITAILIAGQMAGKGLDMLARVQSAHYALGRPVGFRFREASH